jgi:hypothetical protein
MAQAFEGKRLEIHGFAGAIELLHRLMPGIPVVG